MVITSPEQEGANAKIGLQGNEPQNEGIQVWVFKQVSDPVTNTKSWRLKNLKTNLYLCPKPGEPAEGAPIIVLREPLLHNAEWKIIQLE